MAHPLTSLIIPVYRNEGNIPPLFDALELLRKELDGNLEVVFVVDGSPDNSANLLKRMLPGAQFRSQLLLLSRNFGSFAAIQAGLCAGSGRYFGVMAADLQEPPSLIVEFDRILRSGTADIAIGVRTLRDDGIFADAASRVFWSVYRRFVVRDIPPGGVDVFGCNAQVRDLIVELKENNSSLVALLFWAGFRRHNVPYVRAKREIGSSAWTFSKKFRYLSNSIFGFTDLPIRALTMIGVLGLLVSSALSLLTVAAKLTGYIEVPGYAATVLIVTFFGGLNCLGLGVVGNYVWRGFENTKGRPTYVVASREQFSPDLK